MAVIVDAACLLSGERDRLRALAAERGVPCTLLDCQAAVATLRQRVQAPRVPGRCVRGHRAGAGAPAGHRRPLSVQEQRCAIVVHTDGAVDLAAPVAQWQAAGAGSAAR